MERRGSRPEELSEQEFKSLMTKNLSTFLTTHRPLVLEPLCLQ